MHTKTIEPSIFGNNAILILSLFLLILGFSCVSSHTENQHQTQCALTKGEEKRLVAIGQLWGFLKYHHPIVAEGKYDWDAELIKRIPIIIESRNEEEWKTVLDEWVDSLPRIPENPKKKLPDVEIKTRPDYGELFNNEYFFPQTIDKIKYILENGIIQSNYYVSSNKDVYKFENEDAYENILYPDLSYRLLALYRHWNIINYFFPYRDLCDQKWSEVLPEMLSTFFYAKNQEEYILACLKLETKIDDSHGFFSTNNAVLQLKEGLLHPPFYVKFIENKLVVTKPIEVDKYAQENIKIGDIITAIDEEPVDSIVKRMISYTPASNYAVKLRGISKKILRTNSNKTNLTILRNHEAFNIQINCYDMRQLYVHYNNANPQGKGYQIIRNNIGYVLPSGCKVEERDERIKKVLDGTRGLIIDFRCYPSDYLPFLKHLNHWSYPFSLITNVDVSYPGYFVIKNQHKNKTKKIEKKVDAYENKIVIIVNEETQSQAENAVLELQLATNSVVIGSTTAGANGAVTRFCLPGGIFTAMSGVGVYYPDGSDLQRTGVKIDEVVTPTITGVKEGRDELLERAIQIIEDGM